jgi:ABC-type transport system involved in multi-copper enzyme maturation permease subunit
MIGTIAIRVVKENLASRIFLYYTIGLCVLVILGMVDFLADFSSSTADYHRVGVEILRHPSLVSTSAALEPNPSGFVSASDQEILAAVLRIRPYEVEDLGGRLEPRSFLANRDRLDWRFIVGVWASIAALLFSFDALSGEKASKSLSLQFSYPLSRSRFFLGKILGTLATVYVPLAICCLFVLLLVCFRLEMIGFGSIIGVSAMSAAIVLGIAVLYLLFFVLLGWVLSTVLADSTMSLLAGLLLWTLFVWVWPPLSVVVGEKFRPIPGFRDSSAKWRHVQNSWHLAVSSELLKPIVDAPGSETDKRRQIEELAIRLESQSDSEITNSERLARELRMEYTQQRGSQTEFALHLLELSPYGQWKELVDRIGMAGFFRYHEFLHQAQLFSAQFGQYADEMKQRYSSEAGSLGTGSVTYKGYSLTVHAGRDYESLSADWTAFPSFAWKRPALSGVLAGMARPLLLLILSNLILTIMAVFGFGRTDLC